MGYRSKLNAKSGVYPVPIFTKPHQCGGNCLFCPSQKGFPKSFISNEDTVFALQNSFSSRAQFRRHINRLPNELTEQLLPFEIIILGGSFSALDQDYRIQFLSELYTYMSFTKNFPLDFEDVVKLSEKGRYRVSVLSVETRPDLINQKECDFLKYLGVSKVELGVQHTNDKILSQNQRKHGQESVINATNLLKNNGFKVGYHVMTGLPGASFNNDVEMLTTTLWGEKYSPDYLKIYPCVLLKKRSLQPKLYKLFLNEEWSPMDDNSFLSLLKLLSKNIPRYVKISRIQRQFSNKEIVKGIDRGLRAKMKFNIPDIRSREIGIVSPKFTLKSFEDITEKIYQFNNDFFIELSTNNELLLGYARFRIRKTHELIVREVKILGHATPINARGAIQGNGLGNRLINIIENFANKRHVEKILLNAAVGARQYFYKKGYIKNRNNLLEKSLKYCI